MKLTVKPRKNPTDFGYGIKFAGWMREDYENAGIEYIDPMTAKELESEEDQDKCFFDSDYLCEIKFDGTRALLYFTKDGVRVFSRRDSVKTNWKCENTDLVPHIRDMEFPKDLVGTILDCELVVPDQPFSVGQGLMNCLPEEAWKRQQEVGWIHANVFDILYYGKQNLMNVRLSGRKISLNNFLSEVRCEYLDEVLSFSTTVKLDFDNPIGMSPDPHWIKLGEFVRDNPETYLARWINESKDVVTHDHGVTRLCLDKKAFYEYNVAILGGEGVMLKNCNGLYHEKRGWEYSKVKKFLTKDCVILDFVPADMDYKGKAPTTWMYWYNPKTEEKSMLKKTADFIPVNKHFYFDWIGTIVCGVLLTHEDKRMLSSKKKHEIFELVEDGVKYEYLKVVECSGFDEATRQNITENQDEYIGTVVEIRCNEIWKDTGKMRHPRFMRFREDKNPTECTFAQHIGG